MTSGATALRAGTIIRTRFGAATDSRRRLWLRVVVGVILLAVLVVLAAHRYVVRTPYDLQALYDAGSRLRRGLPIYRAPLFVYPPFAAVAAVPISLLSAHHATEVFAVAQVLVPIVAALVLGPLLSRRTPVLAGLVVALVILGSDAYSQSLQFHNVSLLFVLPLTAAVLLTTQGRHHWAAAIVGLSIAVKPLLILLLVLPLLYRRPRAAVTGVATVAVLTLLGTALSHDLVGTLHLPGLLARGSNLRGPLQTGNDSLGSVGVVHPGWHLALSGLRVALLVAAAVVLVGVFRRPGAVARSLCAVSGILVLLPLVAGSLSEIHYGVLAIPLACGVVAARGPLLPRLLGVAALFVLGFPESLVSLGANDFTRDQLRWALGQTTALVACLGATSAAAWPALWRRTRTTRAPSAAAPAQA
jgi:arabinofuranan 3-O-arabinosyltransferase